MQIFASSPGAWKPPVINELAWQRFRDARTTHGVTPLFIHAIYLINLASPNADLVRRSIGSLQATLKAGSLMGAQGVITHIGSHGGRGFDAIADQVAAGLDEILEATPDNIELILENAAGAGGIIGAQVEELGELVRRVGGHPRLRVALDTAHLTASGWDFTREGEAARLADATEAAIGLNRLSALHANDSATPVGSRRDRHANIGEGYVGVAGFRTLLSEARLRSVPWIMETPDLGDRVPGTPTGSLIRLRDLAEEACPPRSARD
jgi:deoxyribonuclease-4